MPEPTPIHDALAVETFARQLDDFDVPWLPEAVES